jgi:hypothetical protein
MTHGAYFSQPTQAAIDNPNWAADLIHQRQSQSSKDGVRDGNQCKADKQRAVVDPDYAAGIEEGFGLIKLMYRINVK